MRISKEKMEGTLKDMPRQPGTAIVYLVGAGPGDPGLITVKGRQCIEAADIIIYDYLASPALLNHARPDAERIYVGKKGGDHTLSQDEINLLLVEKARTGAVVTRLKGGDPFIFGRGGEEAEVLRNAGIDFEIVPGVTSAIAAAAYAGIPLTHRALTSTVAFVTGHEDPTKSASSIDWRALATGIGTLVFFMGVKNLPNIVNRLREGGKPAETPAAVIRWGTTPYQQTVTGSLANIGERVLSAGIKAPAIIVVGEVASLRSSLKWFERRPLLGKTILVTRAREQASDLVGRLSELGAACLEVPTIRVAAPTDSNPLDDALGNLDGYDWIVFTSVNGVACFFDRLFATGKDVRALRQMRTAAIGPATAAKLRTFGLNSDIVPETYRAESVVEAFRTQHLDGSHILVPRAQAARPVLPAALRKMGARVDEVPVYQTLAVADKAPDLVDALAQRKIDVVTFTSSSTVRNFMALVPEVDAPRLLEGVTVASIGPITADTARSLGLDVHISADEYTIPGLCDAIVNFFGEPRQQHNEN
jgi:uroporphyrinogen III methyltransferase/synthase